ncbi:MAG: magnesium transporter [Caulobacterales bacterium 68-7]|nr:magnesium transporter CorA family protein [Caulobacterales bacterium]OJU12480.1 MAG: magnesium transporter [Caulobacterales bacterium 68-7]
MLNILHRGSATLAAVETVDGWRAPDDVVWIDLKDPTRDEELAIEQALGICLPTREDMAEIEPSSRLYQEDGAVFMTATVVVGVADQRPTLAPITFVLHRGRLITIRYCAPRAFEAFVGQLPGHPELRASGPAVFLGLLDALIDRLADILEHIAIKIEHSSDAVFGADRARGGFQPVLRQLGAAQMTGAKARDSLVSLGRGMAYAATASALDDRELTEHLRTLQQDVPSLTDHASYLASNVTFLLDAALGQINIEQNAILKVFSVFTVVFLPPTLIGAIYGMNFKFLPELDWRLGYPMALGFMAISAIAPLLWFKRRGWL